jgi:hypothetical protein
MSFRDALQHFFLATLLPGNTSSWQHFFLATLLPGNTSSWQHFFLATLLPGNTSVYSKATLSGIEKSDCVINGSGFKALRQDSHHLQHQDRHGYSGELTQLLKCP